MIPCGLELATIIQKLCRIDDDHQLEALVLDHAADCRHLPNDREQLFTAAELLRVTRIARVVAQMCEIPQEEAKQLVRSVLLAHPRRQSFLRLIDEYGRDAVAFDKFQHEQERRKATR